MRWHRAGFRRYWRWKSRRRGGRPPIIAELRALIRRMSLENVLWGAPRIQGELLKLGFTVAQSTVAKYMAKQDAIRRPELEHVPAQPCAADCGDGFVRGADHRLCSALCSGDCSAGSARACLDQCDGHPTAEWIAQQITEAFPWNEAPRYLIRDRDGDLWRRRHAPATRHGHSGPADRARVAMAERLRGATDRHDPAGMRRPPDRVGEAHLRRILVEYAAYYNGVRTHRALSQDTPVHRAFSASARSHPGPFSAAFITNIAEFDLRHSGRGSQYTHERHAGRDDPAPGADPEGRRGMHRHQAPDEAHAETLAEDPDRVARRQSLRPRRGDAMGGRQRRGLHFRPRR